MKRRGNSLLAQKYLAVIATMVVVIMIMSIWYSLSVYHSRLLIKEHALLRYDQTTAKELVNTFGYVTNLFKFLGEKIIVDDPVNLDKIATLLQSRLVTDYTIRDQFSWAMFDWSTPEKKMVVSTPWGVMKEPKIIAHRYYAKQAFKEPWVLHFDPVSVGISSNKPVIPAGMGITYPDGRSAGILSLGFNTDRMMRRLEGGEHNASISFMLLSQNYSMVLKSVDNERVGHGQKGLDTFLRRVKLELGHTKSGYGKLAHPMRLGDIIYSRYTFIEGYPFILLTGYNKYLFTQELKETLLPGIIGYSTIGIVSLGFLLLLRNLLIGPLIALSEAADAIAKGRQDIHVPRSRTWEIHTLAKQLIQVQRYIHKQKRTERELVIAKTQAECANKAKSQVLTNMTHELRTPLVTINGYADTIVEQVYGPLNHQYIEAGKFIVTAGDHLLKLINDVLDIAKIEAGRMDLDERECVVRTLLETCQKYFLPMATEKNITLVTDIPEALPMLVADWGRLKQALLNLLSNAIKFTPSGGRVTLSAYIKEEALYLRVEDTGIGIAPEHMPNVLSEFGQVAVGIHDKTIFQQGTGLGLPIVKKLVTLHQGRLTLESALGKGVVATIYLPAGRLRYPEDLRGAI